MVLHRGKALRDANSVALGERLEAHLAHGCLDVEVKGKK